MAEVQAYQQKIAEEMQKLKELETEENKRCILYGIWVTIQIRVHKSCMYIQAEF